MPVNLKFSKRAYIRGSALRGAIMDNVQKMHSVIRDTSEVYYYSLRTSFAELATTYVCVKRLVNVAFVSLLRWCCQLIFLP